MHPLVFLTVRTFVNSVKRAVTTPRRLIGLSVLLFYWFRFFIPIFQGPEPTPPALPGGPVTTLPPVATIEAVVFGGFLFLTVVLMLSAITPRGGFRAADVDVLFPTPVSPKAVMLFRIVRDVLITLLMPLLFAVIARPATSPIRNFVEDFPEQGQLLGKISTVAWLLLVIAWTTIGYALSLFVNRSDEKSDRNKKIMDAGSILLFVAISLYVTVRLRADFSWGTALALTQDPIIRTIFFTATMATSAVMAVFTSNAAFALVGLGGLLLVIVGSLALALTQIDYMYDQAAARGFEQNDLRNLQRSGDVYGMVAAQARKGKVRTGKIARALSRLTMKGVRALLWKELILQARGGLSQYLVFGPITVGMVVLPLWAGSRNAPIDAQRFIFLGFLAMGVILMTFQSATVGFIELLKRVDFQKPLPFSSTLTVFWEVTAKAIPPTVVTIFSCAACLALDPRIWDSALAGLLMAPSLSIVIAAAILLVTVIFPDMEDSTQRSFRGLMVLLGSAIASLPMLGLVVVLTLQKVNGLIIAIPAAGLNLGIALGISAIAGGLYSAYNPSE